MLLNMKLKAFSLLAIVGLFGSPPCPAFGQTEEPVQAIEETGDESARFIQDEQEALTRSSIYEVEQDTNLWFARDQVLNLRVEIPVGTQISIPKNYEFVIMNYRRKDGSVERSTTGFITPIRIINVPKGREEEFPQSRIDKLNATPGGLYVTAAIVGRLGGSSGDFAAIRGSSHGSGYRKHFDFRGRPLYSRSTDGLHSRFGRRVNRGVRSDKQSTYERSKWRRIFGELQRAADRTRPTPKSIIMIPVELAQKAALAFERKGIIPPYGAWTIATQATAVRHGFADRPCAETMSEFLREAYQRAGYDVNRDFSSAKGNQLIWSETASVEGLSRSLAQAGWVPWDMAEYRPPTGAIMMHGSGRTPGHTYISAGDGGRLIVDNGAPQGRDLRATKAKTIALMYKTGVFFLPPGINPSRW